MECVSSMYLGKTCPKCDTVVHVKRAACGCGHKFALKRKGRRSVENESVKRRRAAECEEAVTSGNFRILLAIEPRLHASLHVRQVRRRGASARPGA